MVELILKISPALYQALGIFLPLITTNCAVLEWPYWLLLKNFLWRTPAMLNLPQALVYTAAMAAGFGLALILFAGMREHMELVGVPAPFKGVPIALTTAGILALAFMGFSGIV